jgi:hypothetical protein
LIHRTGMLLIIVVLAFSTVHAQPNTPRTIAAHAPVERAASPRLFGTLLYDQTASMISGGIASQYETDDPGSLYHSQAADDFIVPAEGWQLGGIFVPGFYFSGPGKAQSVDVRIYPDAQGLPDENAAACQYLNHPVSMDISGDLRLELDPVCNLAAGTYWLSVVVNMPYLPSGVFLWQVTSQTTGAKGLWRNPGDGSGTGCTDWTPLDQCPALVSEDLDDDFAFQLYGPSIPDALCTANEIFFADDHEDGFGGWTTAQVSGDNPWEGKTDGGFSGSNYWFVEDVVAPLDTATESLLTSAAVTIPAGADSVFLSFYHRYNMEFTFDGGVVEISVNGGEFVDVGGENFIQNGYDAYIEDFTTSPLANRPAFTGLRGEYLESIVNLDLAPGDQVAVRFRQANDDVGEMPPPAGWWVDDVRMGYCTTFATETPAPTWTPVLPTSTPTPETTATPVLTETVVATPTTESTPAATVSPTAAAGTELLENGGFEAQDLTPWTIKNATGDKLKCNKDKDGNGIPDKIVAHTGDCAFMFKGFAGENSKLSQTVDLTGLPFASGDTLQLNVFVKGSSAATTARIKLRVKYTDETPTGKLNVDILQTADYAPLSGSLDVESAAVGKIKFQIDHKGASGKVYIDDAALTLNSGLLPLP